MSSNLLTEVRILGAARFLNTFFIIIYLGLGADIITADSSLVLIKNYCEFRLD